MNNKHVPSSLEANSKDELQALMRAVNHKFGKKFHFFDFSFAKNMWHCWFELSLVDQVDAERGQKK